MTSAAEKLEGRQLGRYRLRHRLAEGGMANVWLAQLEGGLGFERWVAIKVIHPQLSSDRRFATMLFDEARMAARIHHPNVCAVLDFGEQQGLLYLVMEYLSGETFSSALRRGWGKGEVFPAWLAARVIADAARGLHAAHELTDAKGEPMGLVHRDVSPQNVVVLYDGISKVVDFGIAKAKGRLTVTRKGEVKGKLAYMAPEQLRRGGDIDRRADVWALGVCLWEATLGKRLFKAKTAADTVKRIAVSSIPRPRDIIETYPEELEALVMDALRRDREARTSTAEALADGLDRYLYGLGEPAGHPQVARWMKKRFHDRFQLRQALLSTDDMAAEVPSDDLTTESSLGSKLNDSGSWQSGAFDAPEAASGVAMRRHHNEDATVKSKLPPSGIVSPGEVRAPDEPAGARAPADPAAATRAAELDAEIDAIRRRRRRRWLIVGLLFLVLAAAGALLIARASGADRPASPQGAAHRSARSHPAHGPRGQGDSPRSGEDPWLVESPEVKT